MDESHTFLNPHIDVTFTIGLISPEETIMRLTEGDEELQDVFEFLEELPREFCIHQQVKELSRYMGAKSEDDLDFIGEMCTVFNSMVHNREKRKEKGEVS